MAGWPGSVGSVAAIQIWATLRAVGTDLGQEPALTLTLLSAPGLKGRSFLARRRGPVQGLGTPPANSPSLSSSDYDLTHSPLCERMWLFLLPVYKDVYCFGNLPENEILGSKA